MITSQPDKPSAHQHQLSPTNPYVPDCVCFTYLFSLYITEILNWEYEDFKNAVFLDKLKLQLPLIQVMTDGCVKYFNN